MRQIWHYNIRHIKYVLYTQSMMLQLIKSKLHTERNTHILLGVGKVDVGVATRHIKLNPKAG